MFCPRGASCVAFTTSSTALVPVVCPLGRRSQWAQTNGALLWPPLRRSAARASTEHTAVAVAASSRLRRRHQRATTRRQPGAHKKSSTRESTWSSPWWWWWWLVAVGGEWEVGVGGVEGGAGRGGREGGCGDGDGDGDGDEDGDGRRGCQCTSPFGWTDQPETPGFLRRQVPGFPSAEFTQPQGEEKDCEARPPHPPLLRRKGGAIFSISSALSAQDLDPE